MGEMENLAEFYYEKLKSQANPGQVLLEFFREITGLPAGRSEIIMINKLIKIFGRFTVYFAIMDLSKNDRLEGNLYPYLFTICRSRFERANDTTFSISHEPLDNLLRSLDKEREVARKSKGKIPSSDDLGKEV
jgi:hypothetical protein